MRFPLLRNELYKIFRRPRTYISFGTIAAFTVVIQLAMYANGQSLVEFILQSLPDFEVSGHILNGYLVMYMILGLLLVHVPLLVALVAGDMLAGEAANGTLRLVLSRSVSRTRLVLTKFFATVIYSILLLVWLALVGLAFSVLIFGTGDMLNLRADSITLLQEHDIFWRYCGAFGFAALAMTAIAALSLFLSSMAENAIGPIVSTMGVIILLTLITNLDMPLFATIKPWLFTTHMIAWKGFFSDPVPAAAMVKSALVLVAYVVLFVGATLVVFKRKDIQS